MSELQMILTTECFTVCTCVLYLNDCDNDMYIGMAFI